MPDREKVIDALEACSFIDHPDCSKCYIDGPGFGFACRDQLKRDAIALLKEYVEMEKNYSQVLMETTGNLLSKTNYTVPVIMDCIQNHYCDRCDVKEERDALLKAQEPRVMTLEEAKSVEGYVWLECCDTPILRVSLFHDGYYIEPLEEPFPVDLMNWSDYSKEWRYWTSCPTDAQREATPWQ